MNYSNPYTTAIDNIHVSESAIEAALAAAKLRAAKNASAQAKIRYAAVAASVVLAGAASAVYFGNTARFEPPINRSPVIVTASEAAEPSDGAAAAKESQNKPEQETKAASQNTEPTEQQSSAAETESSERQSPTETDRDNGNTTAPTVGGGNTNETNAPNGIMTPTDAPNPTAAQEPTESEYLPEVDRSLLCEDGKLFIAIAETGVEQIDEPTAFSDDHLLYIETKFGRYYQIKPYSIEPERLTLKNSGSVSEQTCYLYNSDGEIISTVPSWW